MSIRLIAGVVAICSAVMPVSPRAEEAGAAALRINAAWLAGHPQAERIFAPEELAVLRGLLADKAPAEKIDALIAPRTAVEITINPEARVSVRRTGPMLHRGACGASFPLLIRVLNDGFVTSSLATKVLGPASLRFVALDGGRLAGAPVEYRLLQLSLSGDETVGATLQFDFGTGMGDLGGRDRLLGLFECNSRAEQEPAA